MKKHALILFECSGTLACELTARGWSVTTLDLQPADVPSPRGWEHIQLDFDTFAGAIHPRVRWDLVVAHPPCTHTACSGNRWRAKKRANGEEAAAVALFMRVVAFCERHAERWAIEHPVSIISTRWRPPDQYVEPYEHGHLETKKTGFWVGGLPPLQPTNNVKEIAFSLPKKQRQRIHNIGGSRTTRSKRRAKTYRGIARAIADQWG